MHDDFLALTTPTPAGPGRFTIDVPDGWQQGRGAFGGYVVAVLIRAAEATAAAPDKPLRSLTAELPGPTMVGPAELRGEVLRAGSGTSTVAVRLVQEGAVQAHAVCVFGRARATDTNWEERRPALGSWRDVPLAPIQPPFAPTFAQHLELRPTGPRPFAAVEEARAGGWLRFRRPGPARDAAFLAACADAYWPALFSRLPGVRPMATIAFTLQILGHLDGLDPDAPLYSEAVTPIVTDGYAVELRTLRGADGRILAMNQQTFTVIK